MPDEDLSPEPFERAVACVIPAKDEADQIGFSGVMSGPLVRSSYRAGRLYQMAIEQRQSAAPQRGGAVASQAV